MPEGRIVPIANGVDVERFAREPGEDPRSRLGLPADAKLIVSVGNHHPRKGHEVLIDAMECVVRDCPEAHVVFIGRTSPALVRSVAERPIGRAVSFTGPLAFPLPGEDKDDLQCALLRHATAYVSASMAEGTEGLSLAVLEAMAAGACVVATAVSGNKDVVRHRENGLLVPAADSAALAKALTQICHDAALRSRLAEAGRSFVQPWSWRAMAEAYLDVYRRALERRR